MCLHRPGLQLLERRAEIVNDLAVDEFQIARGRHQRDQRRNFVHDRAKTAFARPDGVLGLPAVVDVDSDAVPFDDRARCVRQRIGAQKKPAVCPVEAPQACFHLAGLAASQNGTPAFQSCGQIVGVHPIQPSRAARVFAPASIDEVNLTVRQRSPNQPRKRIDNAAAIVLHTHPFTTQGAPPCETRPSYFGVGPRRARRYQSIAHTIV